MGVIPIGPDLIGHEAIRELTADRHLVLGDAGHTVHGRRYVVPVPVQRDARVDRGVPHVHFDQLALVCGDRGPG